MATVISRWEGGTPKHWVEFIRLDSNEVMAKIYRLFLESQDGSDERVAVKKHFGDLQQSSITVDLHSTTELLGGKNQVTTGISKLSVPQQNKILNNIKNLGVTIKCLPDRAETIRLYRFA